LLPSARFEFSDEWAIMSLTYRFCRAERGVAAIEGAIVLFALIFLLFTLMEFLYVLFAYNTVVRGAENAARYAMVNSQNGCAWLGSNVTNSVANVGVIPVTISVVSCTPGTPSVCNPASASAPAGSIIIHAEYDFDTSGFFVSVLASTLPIEATVCVPLMNST
jgi:Flp pilus assembly protein TadG